jgi:hypothetical protein
MQSDLSRGRSLTVDGRDYVQPFSRTPEGREERATQTQRDRDKLLAQQVRERDAARAKAEEETARARTARTGLSPKDRAYAATLQFAKTPTSVSWDGERTFPNEQEIAEFAQQAMAAAGQVYENAPRPVVPVGSATGTGGAQEWMIRNPKYDDESPQAYRARYEASKGAASSSPVAPSAPTATPPDSAINSPRVASIKRQLDELSQGRYGSVAARERYESYAPQRLALEQELQELGLRYSRGYITSARNR